MEVFFDDRQSKLEIDEKNLNQLILVIEEVIKLENVKGQLEISVSFVDDKEIKALNNDYRGKDKATDVLSFPIEDDFFTPIILLGDVIISVETALEQSIEYGHSLERELSYLTCHSILHLLGYDHIDDEEKKVMRNKEKTIMKNLALFKGDNSI